MNPASAAIYRYSIPFVRPVPVRTASLDKRDGLIVRLQSADGRHTGFGEVAPLPGLHSESLEEALHQLSACLRRTLPGTGHLTLLNVSEALQEKLYPSVRTGIEMALLNFQASVAGTFPGLPCCRKPAEKLPLNALLFGDTPTVLNQAEEYYRQGYRTFKLKASARDSAAAIDRIRALDTKFKNDITLRLDSNQTFDLASATLFLNALPKKNIAYIEEPLQYRQEIAALTRASGIRVALDESLWQEPALRFSIPAECLGGYVLKPARIGGIAATMKLALEASQKGIPAIISSGFESGVSLGFYAQMAAHLGADPPACGIDTFRQLGRDILITPLSAGSGELSVETAWRRSTMPDLSRLTCIGQWIL